MMFPDLFLSAQDSSIRATTAYFSIERAEATAKLTERKATEADRSQTGSSADDLLLNSLKYREVGRLQRVASEQDMRRLVNDEYLTALREITGKSTNAQLAEHLYRHPNIYEFFFKPGDTELQRLLGHLYLDTDVKPDILYFYRVIRVTQDDRKQPWGKATTVSGVSNEILNGLQVKARSLSATDSLVSMQWKVPVSQFDARTKPQRPARMSPADSTFRRYITNHLISPELIQGQIMVYDGSTWKPEVITIPGLNETGDSLVFSWQKRCLPENVVRAFVVPHDIVGNSGTASDTLTGVAVSEGRLKLIYGITARDTVDAIRISWAKLPAKPYYTGIEVSRNNGPEPENIFTVLAQLTPQDSLYYDYQVKPGVNYTYHVRPIFIPLQGLVQNIPAEAIGTSTRFSKPLPVSDLEISNEGQHVRLSWKGTDSPSMFGYFVYRGTTKDCPEPLKVSQ